MRGRGWLWLLIGLVVVAALLAVWQRPAPTSGPTSGRGGTVTGTARVVDGDTLAIGGTRVRLYGIDAPEHDQTCTRRGQSYPCGQDAATALRGLLSGQATSCERQDTDRYGRTVALCRVGSTDVNGWMVQNGYALAYRAYSTRYVPQENAARAARRGLHAGTYTNPADFRRGETTPASTSTRRTPFKSCREARAAGRTPILRGEPGYNARLDGDKDGKICE